MPHRAATLFLASLILSCLSTDSWLYAQSPNKVKNVLLIVADDLKASVLGCYGDPHCQTPNIDRLAARGMLFESAYCQGVWCAPSRQSFMFSRYQIKPGSDNPGKVNLGQNFKQHGWFSARVGKIYHMRVPGDIIDGTDGLDVPSSWTEKFNSSGLEAHTPGAYACLNLNIFTDELEGRQSTAMPHRMFVSVEMDGDGSDQPDYKSATKAMELLQQHRQEPFFLAVGLVRPHYPMVAPSKYFQDYPWQELSLPTVPSDDLDDIPKLGRAGTLSGKNPIGKYPDNQKRMWAAYYASVAFMDAQVGRILDELDRLGLRDSTAVVFTSDHGYHLGEHTFWQKSNLHEEVIRVPLILSTPGKPAGRTSAIAELVDLYPTLSEIVGIPIPETVQGASLVPVLDAPEREVKKAALSFHKGASYRTQDWHLMTYNDDTQELYDMQNDPAELTNLANRPAFESVQRDLTNALQARLKELDLPSVGNQ